MELLIIVVVLVALAFLIGAPLAAISKASNAQEENDLLKDRVSDLETQLNQLRAKVDSAFSGNASTSQKTETAPPASSNVAAKTVLAAPPILPKMDERPIPSTVGEPPVLAAMFAIRTGLDPGRRWKLRRLLIGKMCIRFCATSTSWKFRRRERSSFTGRTLRTEKSRRPITVRRSEWSFRTSTCSTTCTHSCRLRRLSFRELCLQRRILGQ